MSYAERKITELAQSFQNNINGRILCLALQDYVSQDDVDNILKETDITTLQTNAVRLLAYIMRQYENLDFGSSAQLLKGIHRYDKFKNLEERAKTGKTEQQKLETETEVLNHVLDISYNLLCSPSFGSILLSFYKLSKLNSVDWITVLETAKLQNKEAQFKIGAMFVNTIYPKTVPDEALDSNVEDKELKVLFKNGKKVKIKNKLATEFPFLITIYHWLKGENKD